MAIRVQTEFIRKGTVRIIVYVYDDDGDLVPATTGVDISIVDPTGEVVEKEQAMTPGIPGVYEFFYTTTEAVEEGDYQIECDITDNSYHTYVHGHFSMKAGINEA